MFKCSYLCLCTDIGETYPEIQIQTVTNSSLVIDWQNVLADKTEMASHYGYSVLYRISEHRNWTRVDVTFDDGPRETSVADSLQPNTVYQVRLQAYRQHLGQRQYTDISNILKATTACGGKESLCEGKGPLCEGKGPLCVGR